MPTPPRNIEKIRCLYMKYQALVSWILKVFQFVVLSIILLSVIGRLQILPVEAFLGLLISWLSVQQ